ncbi:MAG: histidinol dehydrogenase [Planctomycetes bacterium]|nr:histidinol dehydrogenase [Planctomycetota bacterium]
MGIKLLLKDPEQIRQRISKALNRLGGNKGQQGPKFNTFGELQSLEDIVREIISRVSEKGDLAVAECLSLIDKADVSPKELVVSQAEFEAARKSLSPELENSLQLMARRLRDYAEQMMPPKLQWFSEVEGRKLGYRFTPIENLGAYVPGGLGGSTPLISTVLMNLIPAKVAGVEKVVVATPCTKDGTVHPALLRACEIAGVDVVYKAGGAQGVAAMAMGTESCPSCSKIIGPGNAFVQEAKKQLYGMIDIDMMAGPSEIAIMADDTAKSSVIAADMIAQAEHDVLASSMVFSTSETLLKSVEEEVEKQLAQLPKAEIARKSLTDFGALCLCSNTEEACDFVNLFAPEHLELCVDKAHDLLDSIKHAGALFIGHNTPEVVGDYTAGPSHTLPTCGAARFTSGITVYSFLKSSSLLEYSQEAMKEDLSPLTTMARAENLEGHARSAESRF